MAVAVSGLCAPVTKEADMTLRVFPTIHVAVLLAGAICLATVLAQMLIDREKQEQQQQMYPVVPNYRGF